MSIEKYDLIFNKGNASTLARYRIVSGVSYGVVKCFGSNVLKEESVGNDAKGYKLIKRGTDGWHYLLGVLQDDMPALVRKSEFGDNGGRAGAYRNFITGIELALEFCKRGAETDKNSSVDKDSKESIEMIKFIEQKTEVLGTCLTGITPDGALELLRRIEKEKAKLEPLKGRSKAVDRMLTDAAKAEEAVITALDEADASQK